MTTTHKFDGGLRIVNARLQINVAGCVWDVSACPGIQPGDYVLVPAQHVVDPLDVSSRTSASETPRRLFKAWRVRSEINHVSPHDESPTEHIASTTPLSLSTRFKRAAGAQEFGGAATKRLIALAVYSTPDRQAAAGEEITLEQIVASAVAELVSQLRHFRLDGDVLRALQTHESTSDSAQSAAARPTASPQSAADR